MKQKQMTPQLREQAGYTECISGNAMKIHTANAQSIGSLILDGEHKPFHALACPLKRPASVRISKKA